MIVSELFFPSLLLVPRLGSKCPYQTSLLAEQFGIVLNGISATGCCLHSIRSLFVFMVFGMGPEPPTGKAHPAPLSYMLSSTLLGTY